MGQHRRISRVSVTHVLLVLDVTSCAAATDPVKMESALVILPGGVLCVKREGVQE